MSAHNTADALAPYLIDAVRGERRPAVRITLDLFDRGVPEEQVVTDLLATAQREVGERWHRGELTVADEHLATGVSTAALDALANEARHTEGQGRTVVACAEGDWHSLAAQMFGESLRAEGVGVLVLGASLPAESVAEFLARQHADSLAVSCTLPHCLPGVARLVDAAHAQGIPVIVGGRALGTDDRRARSLGADAWALTAAAAAPILAGWRSEPPEVNQLPTTLDASALRLHARADELGRAAIADLGDRYLSQTEFDEHEQLRRTPEYVEIVVQVLAAAIMVGDDSVFTEFLDWLEGLFINHEVRPEALVTAFDSLLPLIDAIDSRAVVMLEQGREGLLARIEQLAR